MTIKLGAIVAAVDGDHLTGQPVEARSPFARTRVRLEHRPAQLILNPAQAEAVYSAMCALNNVCSVFGDVRIPAERAQQDIRIQWDEAGVTVGQGLRIVIERYDDQHAFSTAYGLNADAAPIAATLTDNDLACGA